MNQSEPPNTPRKIKVAILDDHQSIIDGYLYRLSNESQIEVVGTAQFGVDLEQLLANHSVDVLFLDISMPTAPDNSNPYPILYVIPDILQKYPNMSILVISMLAEQALIQEIMDAGASGYILKDDSANLQTLSSVVVSVANGGICLSKCALELLTKDQTKDLLTPRQLEILSLCAAYPDWPQAKLATKLGIAHATVRTTLSKVYVQLGVSNLMGAITKARQIGLITPLSTR